MWNIEYSPATMWDNQTIKTHPSCRYSTNSVECFWTQMGPKYLKHRWTKLYLTIWISKLLTRSEKLFTLAQIITEDHIFVIIAISHCCRSETVMWPWVQFLPCKLNTMCIYRPVYKPSEPILAISIQNVAYIWGPRSVRYPLIDVTPNSDTQSF